MAKYGKAASKSVESAMRRKKSGTLKSSTGRKVTSEKQAIAIGLSEAREKGAKVPPPKGRRKAGKSAGTAAKKSATAAKTSTTKGRTTSRTKAAKKR